jgi:hypothetical protein
VRPDLRPVQPSTVLARSRTLRAGSAGAADCAATSLTAAARGALPGGRSGHGVIAGLVACWSPSTPMERDHVRNEYASICRSRRVPEGDLDSSHR